MEHVVLRPPLVIGPGVKGNLLRLLRLIDRGIPLPLASVRNVRSLICLDNLCDVLVRCIDHPAAAGRTFLAADGTDVSTPNLLRAMAAALDVPLRMLPFPVGLLGVAARMFGRGGEFERLAGSLQVDSAEIRDVLGWRPPVAFADQMAATADWYRTVGRL
jgi:nucleoside-diphosphate-sugar epimerase